MSDAAAAASSDTMQALLLHSYAKATADAEQKGAYRVEAVPKPQIKEPLDILVQVHAASINPIDWKIAQGDLKLLLQETFPAKLGYDLSGVVVSIGAGVSKFAVGDEVISRVSATQKGTFAEFAVTSEDITVKKPANLSHVEASCIPLAGLTALQCIKLSSVADKPAPRSAFLPAALGGVGSMAIQIARHHFHLEKIVTAVSTNKVAQTQQLLGGDDLDIVDYKTTNVADKYRGQLDFVLDNTGEAAAYMPMLKPTPEAAQIAADRKARGEAMSQGADTPSRIVSIATAPDGEQAAGFGGSVPWLVKQVLNFKDWRLRSAAKSAGGQYSYLLLHENAPELQILADLATAGHLKPVVGKVFPLREARKAMEASADNAVTGKVVIQMPVDAPAAGVAVGAAAPAAEEEKSAQ